MRQEQATSRGYRHFLSLFLGVAAGCVAALLTNYVLYGPDDFIYHSFVVVSCWLSSLLCVKFFRPQLFRKTFGPKP
jgi:hypothetical protein